MKLARHMTIKTIPQGIEIAFVYPNVTVLREFLLGLSVLAFLSVCGFTLFMFIWWTIQETQNASKGVAMGFAMLPMIPIVIYFFLRVPQYMALLTTPMMRLSGPTVTLGTLFFGKGKTTPYEITSIRHLRVVPQDDMLRGILQFDYTPYAKTDASFSHEKRRPARSGTAISCCPDLEIGEAQRVVNQLSNILQFHCHAVEDIIFGRPPSSREIPITIRYNPEVTDLSFPFVRLHHLHIETSSYDFHLIERFLTYAINYIGQPSLKDHVDVHLYGERDQLHPHLLNNLTNLCKRVYLHEKLEHVTVLNDTIAAL